MQLPNELISEFVKATKDNTKVNDDSVLYGTAKVEAGGNVYVTIDGSTELTPVTKAATVNDGERVMVTIKDHTATIVGNMSSPAARSGDVEDLGAKVGEFNLVIADKVSTNELAAQVGRIDDLVADNATIKGKLVANDASIKNLEAEDVKINGTLEAQQASIDELETKKINAETVEAEYATIESLNATNASIKNLEAEDVKINGTLDAQKAVIDNLGTTYATIENLNATNAEIVNLKADKIDADVVEATYATIENLKTTNAEIEKLEADKIDADEVEANYATIEKLQAEYATITSLENKYANIDFSNIGMLAVKELFAQSGLIKDLVVEDTKITGELVGVTIKGELIEAGTLKADRLVVKGSDGNYYKINTDFTAMPGVEPVEEDAIHGSTLIKESITADKISVSDLVAFGATIGGFHITNNSIYSGVKETVGNTTKGIYIDNDGQIALGDSANYLKFYNDTDGKYKLDISAASLTFGDNGTSMEQFQKDTIVSTVEEFVKSTSPTSLSNTNWSTEQPVWEDGTYIWRRNKVTYGDGSVYYTPGPNGVCITGNTGAQGEQGPQGIQGIQGETGKPGANGTNGVSVTSVDVHYYRSTSNTQLTGGSWSTTAPTWVDGTYMWTKTVVTYSSGDPSESTPVCITGAKGSTGAAGSNGTNGTNGTNGVGVKSIVEQYYQSTSATALSGGSWSPTYPGWVDGRYIWTKSVITYTNNESVDTTPICVSGSKGATGQKGDTGDKGDQGEQGPKGDDGQMLYATCSTAVGTTAKVATLSSGTLTLRSGVSVAVKFTYANGVASPTLNVAGTGAKSIRLNGSALNTISDYWAAGATVTFVYDGSYWNITSVSDAAKTASNFMYVDSENGLQIGDRRTGSWAGCHTRVTNNAFEVLDSGDNTLAHYGAEEILLGKEGGFRAQVVPQAFNILDSSDNTALSMFYTSLGNESYSTIKGLRTQLIGDRYAKLGSFLVESKSGTYYANEANVYTSAFNNPEISLTVSRYESDSEGSSAGSDVDTSTMGVSPDQITLLNNTRILLEAPFVDIEGNGNVTGELSAGSVDVSGDVTIDGLYYDNLGQPIRNGLVAYSSSGIDSNTTLEHLILTSTNTPTSAFYYVWTLFYSTKSTSANRAQVAIPYSAAGAIYFRYYYNGSWSAWRKPYYGGEDAEFSKIELARSAPYIDFKHGSSTADYTQRIITSGSGLNIYGTANTYVAVMSDRFRSNGNDVHYLGDASNKWKDVYSVKSSINTSDRNQKKNIEPINDKYVELFDKLQPVSYEFNSPTSDRTHLGFISQDVKETMDEVGLTDLDFAAYCRDIKMETVEVTDPETGETKEVEKEVLDENGDPVYLYSLRYSEFIALNTKMIQLNKQKIAEQEREIESLRGEVSALKEMVEKLLANQ